MSLDGAGKRCREVPQRMLSLDLLDRSLSVGTLGGRLRAPSPSPMNALHAPLPSRAALRSTLAAIVLAAGLLSAFA